MINNTGWHLELATMNLLITPGNNNFNAVLSRHKVINWEVYRYLHTIISLQGHAAGGAVG